MTTSERLIAQAETILDQAFAASDISHVVALFSGGHDSAVHIQLPIHAFNPSKDTTKPLRFAQAWPRTTQWCTLHVPSLEKLTDAETEAYKTSERWHYLHDYEENNAYTTD